MVRFSLVKSSSRKTNNWRKNKGEEWEEGVPLAETCQAVNLKSTIPESLLSTYYTPSSLPSTGDVAMNGMGKIYYSCKP